MRRPTTVLLVIAAVIVAVALALRSGDSDPSTTTIAAATTSTFDEQTTTSLPATDTPPTSDLPFREPVCSAFGDVTRLGTVASPDLVEASGIAWSRTSPDVLWAHNDSRGGPVLYAFRPDGSDLGSFEVPDAFAIDWEDMAAGPDATGAGNYLYVGDMGDNFGIRDGMITVWRVPDLAPEALDGRFPDSQPFVFRMPDGPQDAEALFVDPVDPAIYIITKSRSEAFVYRGELGPADGERPMELVATLFLDAEVSGADVAPDGRMIALRGYDDVWLWQRDPAMSIGETLSSEPCSAPSPEERQGEAIAFDSTYGYYTVSEGTGPAVHYVPVTP